MSQLLSSLTDRVKQLEARDEKNLLEIERLTTDLESAKRDISRLKTITVDISVAYSKRLRSKDSTKPGPLLVDLSDAAIRNPVLLAAKKFREFDKFKSVYISPDLTEAERQLDYKFRQERNRLNAELGANSPFRYGIRGN
ncbi:hypothetical protein HELRODRAFT_169137 [Helobdella robusta]|uniref:Uncharacterized protein n=1 Tax=Helobdella robusta TaxID=6412 RepID=T1F1G2_HELRO|nr:hypothetical protein HELRODRAFT_169137 [Helobdella robusta]ESO08328.1 hypothetical protein HELRODRAFT_169137 [Helobdella robusta]